MGCPSWSLSEILTPNTSCKAGNSVKKVEMPKVDRTFRGEGKGVAKITWTEPIGVLEPSQGNTVGGSRYESGREIPESVQYLLHLAYGTEKQAGALLDFIRGTTAE